MLKNKKIKLISSRIALATIMIAPVGLLLTNNSVNAKNKIDENINEPKVTNDILEKTIGKQERNNSLNAPYEIVGDIINANDVNCTAENSGQNTNTWMGITKEFVKFKIIKDFVNVSNPGQIVIDDHAYTQIASTKLTIPSYIMFSGKKYIVTGFDPLGWGFSYCTGLIGTLTIPSTMTSIGDYAFFGCSGLTGTLIIPSSVTSIGNYAFSECTGFTGSLIIPKWSNVWYNHNYN